MAVLKKTDPLLCSGFTSEEIDELFSMLRTFKDYYPRKVVVSHRESIGEVSVYLQFRLLFPVNCWGIETEIWIHKGLEFFSNSYLFRPFEKKLDNPHFSDSRSWIPTTNFSVVQGYAAYNGDRFSVSAELKLPIPLGQVAELRKTKFFEKTQ